MTMLIHLSRLRELRERSAGLRSFEAVAIAQQLMHDDVDTSGARAPFGPLSAETVGIDVSGRVHCHGCAVSQSVAEVAIFLQGMLDEFVDRVPAGLRHALARALHDVDAPPFDSGHEFGAVLARFERGARTEVLRRLFRRVSETASDLDPDAPFVERRRGGPSAADLRRELREADLHLYEARAAARRMATRRSSGGAMKVAPMIACMVSGVALIAAGEYVAQVTRSHAAAAGRGSATAAPLAPTRASFPRVVPLPNGPTERVLAYETGPATTSNRATQRRVSASDRSRAAAGEGSRASAGSRSRAAKPVRRSSDSDGAASAARLEWWNGGLSRAH